MCILFYSYAYACAYIMHIFGISWASFGHTLARPRHILAKFKIYGNVRQIEFVDLEIGGCLET